LEEELEKQAVLNNNLNARIKMLEYHLSKSILGLNKKKSKSNKKRKRTIHHQRGYSDSVHNPINYTMISHHKRGSSGSGSSGNQWKMLFQTEAFDEGSDTINFLTNTSDVKHKSSYDGTNTIYTTDSNFKQESTTKQITKTKQQPSQAAIVTTTTTITTTPLQNYISGKHGKRSSSNIKKRCYDNVTQKRKWMVREFNKSKDLNLSEIKDVEEKKCYKNLHNSSVELEQKSAQLLLKTKSNSIYKTQERINSKAESSFFRSETETSDILGGPATLKRKLWKIKYSLKGHLDSVRSLYFNMNMNIMASASEDRTIRLWKADTFCSKDVDDDFVQQQQVFSYMTLRGHTGALFAMSGAGEMNMNSNKKILYSAGEEGVIRVWKIPSPIYFDSIDSTHEHQHCIGVWEHHSDAVWDLQHHPTENCILSLSADNEIALWMTLGEDENIDN
jgi:WD40 repeat protein